ncbi:MAG: DUF1592 domain-containing protein [Planctomycetes bacterium]|nr:DUF1592 domain-containing protein [Planctomycetota bacterium]
MRRLGIWLISGLLPLSLSALSLTTAVGAESSFTKDVKPLLETYCVTCHNPEKKKADLDLTIYKDDSSASRATKLWRNVIDQVGDHLMPPDTAKKRPSMEEREALVKALKNLKKYDGPPDPGRVTIRRLNRTEYDYTIRDLIGIDMRTARSSFPSDDVGEGFDNIGDVLSLPPLLLEKYLDAATTILDKAIVAQPLYVSYNGAQLPAIHEGKTVPAESGSGPRDFTSHGEAILTVAVPADGKYNLKIRVGQVPAGPDPAVLVVKVDNQVVKELKATAKKGNPPSQTVPLTLEKGSRRITLHFANPFTEPAPDKDAKPKPGEKKGDGKPAVRTLSIASLELTGGPGGGKNVERNKRIFVAEPTADIKPRDAAVKIVDQFASLAFRRPATKEQVERLLTIFDRATKEGETFDEAIKYTLKAVLVSPAFLYRIETDRKATLANNAYPLDDYELASRLSYFLWSSMPDAELFDLAKQGKLRDPAMVEKQARRMLKDGKAHALAETFGEQWLTLRSLEEITPDLKKFPDYNRQLKTAMYDEAMMFFEYIMQDDRSILEFLDADYTFVNERLAKHYGLPNVSGLNMRRVELKDRNRGGVLTMAAVLTVTSQPGRTSPVKRGKWILEQIVGEPPPPPPAAVPPLEEQDKGITASLSLREKMVKHRQDPVCASCHIKMDAIGFGFENYDAIGRWRTSDEGVKLDTAGDLPGGVKFSNAVELKTIFMSRKDAFTRCVTEKMLIFALGRGLMDYDDQVVESISAAVAKNEYRMSTLITRIVTSYPFMNRRNP